MEPIVVTYTSRRWNEALAEVRFRNGVVIALTSDLRELFGYPKPEPHLQRSLWE